MTAAAPNAAILNDLDRIERGEVKDIRELSTDFLKVIAADEDKDFLLRNAAQNEITIRKDGIAILAVAEQISEEDQLKQMTGKEMQETQPAPAFVYTIGAERIGLPEMLTFYPHAQTTHHVLNQVHKLMLDDPNQVPATEDEIKLFDVFDNPELPVIVTLLTKEEREWAYEGHTCQVENADTPVLLVHIPMPNGAHPNALIPEELQGFKARINKRYGVE